MKRLPSRPNQHLIVIVTNELQQAKSAQAIGVANASRISELEARLEVLKRIEREAHQGDVNSPWSIKEARAAATIARKLTVSCENGQLAAWLWDMIANDGPLSLSEAREYYKLYGN